MDTTPNFDELEKHYVERIQLLEGTIHRALQVLREYSTALPGIAALRESLYEDVFTKFESRPSKTEPFNPDKVKRIKWSNGAEVVPAMDYDRLYEAYKALLPKQITLEEVYGEIEVK